MKRMRNSPTSLLPLSRGAVVLEKRVGIVNRASWLLVSLALLGCDEPSAECSGHEALCENAAAFCERADECEGVELLVSPEECGRQVTTALLGSQFTKHARAQADLHKSENSETTNETKDSKSKTTAQPSAHKLDEADGEPQRPPPHRKTSEHCQQCVTSLTCAGMTKVAHGEIVMRDLCSSSCGAEMSSPKKRVVIHGIGPAPLPVDEEATPVPAEQKPAAAPAAPPPGAAAQNTPAPNTPAPATSVASATLPR